MKKHYLFIIIIAVLFACSKEKQTVIDGRWEVEGFIAHQDSALRLAPNSYVLSFSNGRDYSINLDANSMSGKVVFKLNNKIEFTSGAITEICCDSEFAEKLILLLFEINKYELNDNILTLIGSNGISIILKEK